MNMNGLQTLIVSLRQRFDALPPNDRRALLIMSAAIAVTVLYFSLNSSREYQQSALLHYQDARENSRWINLNLAQIRSMAGAASKPGAAPVGGSDASLINRATTTAKPFGIVFKRFQPEGDTGLRLWIEAAEFDQLIRWTGALEQQQIVLEQLDVDKLDKQPGLVDARVLISLKP
jgi:general secretion pathway protein M